MSLHCFVHFYSLYLISISIVAADCKFAVLQLKLLMVMEIEFTLKGFTHPSDLCVHVFMPACVTLCGTSTGTLSASSCAGGKSIALITGMHVSDK